MRIKHRQWDLPPCLDCNNSSASFLPFSTTHRSIQHFESSHQEGAELSCVAIPQPLAREPARCSVGTGSLTPAGTAFGLWRPRSCDGTVFPSFKHNLRSNNNKQRSQKGGRKLHGVNPKGSEASLKGKSPGPAATQMLGVTTTTSPRTAGDGWGPGVAQTVLEAAGRGVQSPALRWGEDRVTLPSLPCKTKPF